MCSGKLPQIRKIGKMERDRILFVSRFDATIEFMRRMKPEWSDEAEVFSWISDKVIATLKPDDTVVGIMTIPVAAKVCATGAEYWHVLMPGKSPPMTANEMLRAGIKMTKFFVEPEGDE